MNRELVKSTLDNLEHFYFLPNRGNLGDVVIAASEYQFFSENNYNYSVLDVNNLPTEDCNIVYGGGGLWTKYYGFSDITDIFALSNIKKIILLPSSINECDDFVESLDERYTVFCREEKSYNYCISKNQKAKFILANDMAIDLNIDFYKNAKRQYIKNVDSNLIKEIYLKLYKPYKNILNTIPEIYKKITYKSDKAIGYFLRGDIESNTDWTKYDINLNVDLSQILGSYCIDSSFSMILSKIFLSMIDTVDIVVTDRLHVGICGCLLGKEVILIDNSYGKVSSVYNYSFSDKTNIRLINADNLDETINSIVNTTAITRKNKIQAPGTFYSFLSEYLLNKQNDKYENIMWSNAPEKSN